MKEEKQKQKNTHIVVFKSFSLFSFFPPRLRASVLQLLTFTPQEQGRGPVTPPEPKRGSPERSRR